MDNPRNTISRFPIQTVADSKKTDNWLDECIDAADELALQQHEGVRKSYRQKKINYNLVNNILTPSDMQRAADPWNINTKTFPANPQNYPIIWPRLNVLIGEEAKRKFDWRVRIGNANVISAKSEEVQERLMELVEEAIINPNLSEQEIEKRVKKLGKWSKYSHQDIREITANNLLKYFWKTESLKRKFNDGFADALISSEEIYAIDIYGKTPSVEKLSPLEVHTINSGNSNFIEDSDIIIIERYMPVGKVVEKYYDELTPAQVKALETGAEMNTNDFISVGEREASLMLDETFESRLTDGGLIEIDPRGRAIFSGKFDQHGNVRVVRVLWKSKRKLKVIGYNDEFGNKQIKYRDEKYKPIEALGETLEDTIYANESYEGTKIGDDIKIKKGPRPVQFLDIDNPSKCHHGVVGTVYNIDLNEGMSMVDMMKPYQYLYNVFMYRTELAFAKSHGKVLKLDSSLIPDKMELDEFMHYLTNVGVVFEDPFTEANKKPNRGSNLSSMSRGSSSIDLSMSAYINQHLEMMNYVEQQCGRIVGITPQREGQISQRETVGGVERSVTQSNHITERYFMLHDSTKKRVLEALLETAKYAWKDKKSVKLQYVLDDFSTEMLDIDVETFSEYNYDIHISHSQDDMEIIQAIKELAHAGIQNDKLKFKDLMSIYHSDSVAEMRRQIETSEEEAEQKQQERFQAEQEMAQEQLMAQQERDEKERMADTIEKAKDRQHEITLEQMKLNFKEREMQLKWGTNEEQFSKEKEKLKLEQEKLTREIEIKQRELDLKERERKDKREIEIKKISAMKQKSSNK